MKNDRTGMDAGVHIVEGSGRRIVDVPDVPRQIREHGAVLLRGFTGAQNDFVAFTHRFGRNFFNVSADTRIREMVSKENHVAGVLKGTYAVPPHQEYGWSPLRPELVFFLTIRPSAIGGESLVCSTAQVMARLPAAVRDRLANTRIKYTHEFEPIFWTVNYGPTREAVERFFASCPDVVDFSFEGDILKFTYLTPAFLESRLEPGLGYVCNIEGMWIAQQEHRSRSRDSSPQGFLLEHTVGFEDGEPMTQSFVDEIHRAVEGATVAIRQEAGDILVLDNFRYMHGRNAFEGPRELHTVIADANF